MQIGGKRLMDKTVGPVANRVPIFLGIVDIRAISVNAGE